MQSQQGCRFTRESRILCLVPLSFSCCLHPVASAWLFPHSVGIPLLTTGHIGLKVGQIPSLLQGLYIPSTWVVLPGFMHSAASSSSCWSPLFNVAWNDHLNQSRSLVSFLYVTACHSLVFYFGVFICFGLCPLPEYKLQERKFISILFLCSFLSALNSS